MFEKLCSKEFSVNKDIRTLNEEILAILKEFGVDIIFKSENKIRFKTGYTFNHSDMLSGIQNGIVRFKVNGDSTEVTIILNFKTLIKKNLLYTIVPFGSLTFLFLLLFVHFLTALLLGISAALILLIITLPFIPLNLYMKTNRFYRKIIERVDSGI